SSTDGGRTWKAFAHKASAATTIPVSGLVNGTGYLFRIAAVNDVGTGAFTTPTVAVVPATLPGIVADLAVTTDSGRTKLAWKAPASNGGTAILDYSIQWSDDDGRNWKTFAHKVSTATSATIAGLVSAASYRYRLAALNAVGTGGSIEVSKTVI
ncbi:MAG: fibronectin type III domain-containing protein, partial [Planctomycetia bacterium]